MTQRTYHRRSSSSSQRPSQLRSMSYWTWSTCFDCAGPCTRKQPSTNSATDNLLSPSQSRQAKRSSASYFAIPSSMNCWTTAGDLSASRKSWSSSSEWPCWSMWSKSCLIFRSMPARLRSSRRASLCASDRAIAKTFSTTTAVMTLSMAKFMNIMKGTKKIHASGSSVITLRTMSGQSSNVINWNSVKTEEPMLPNQVPMSPTRLTPPLYLPNKFVVNTADR
mmetsp:Transcript_92692/g.271352  ORF Transcript_92692/g.271352 Transcript_92692/m.271352 type:complete len:222 (-) Transcript_92692:874-1539(-)